MTTGTLTDQQFTFSETPRVSFSTLVKVEIRKMTDTRAGFWLMLVIGLVTAAIDIGMLCFAAFGNKSFSLFDFVTVPSIVLGILLPVLGIMAVTSETSQRTAMVTYTLEPHRERIVLAKLVASLMMAVGAVVTAVVAGVLANVIFAAVGPEAAVWNFHLANLGAFALQMVLALLVGFAFGTLFMNTAVAIVVYFVYTFVIPGLLAWLAYAWHSFDKIHKWVDFSAAQGPLQDQHIHGMQWGALITSGVIWLGLPLFFGVTRLLRAEVK